MLFSVQSVFNMDMGIKRPTHPTLDTNLSTDDPLTLPGSNLATDDSRTLPGHNQSSWTQKLVLMTNPSTLDTNKTNLPVQKQIIIKFKQNIQKFRTQN